ncbi:type II toxin-antitoxin system HicA family toxin [Paenibacillus nanensis]|uniref:Type II toxin-antitoxin system HicA family toxin n=1 Tax=Paenibacillus nanensis TaxID=393251 RepID=A0A3A1UT63_9BACL|nr:type II toxin-antitoxin system HicA family toxin [Paenibacillus nanensis]RIX51729.1 type II toxin-antitoxin system HicA family toxin [Paenibacillus nanensis]
MSKPVKAAALGIAGLILFCLLLAGLYVHNMGLNNIKLMYELHRNNHSILRMETEGQYVTKTSYKNERLLEKMKEEGWTFVGQEGSGYFFERNGQKTIVTAKQIWNRHYIMYQVTDHAVDLTN